MDPTRVTIRGVASVGADTVALTFETPAGFDALPGQFVLLRAEIEGEERARHYTLSSPGVDETFEVTVGVDPEGEFTPWLAAREPGDDVTVEGPFGHVAYDPGSDGGAVAIAGGPGVGAAVGIGEAAMGAGNDVAVVYEDDRPAHQDRLAALSAAGADVTVVTDGGLAAAVEGLGERHPDLQPGQVYVFGFRTFLDRALPALEAAGVDTDDANVENFG